MFSESRRADFERSAARRRLVDAAVEKLYLRRSGASLDAQLRMYDAAISIAVFCRESELERAKTGIFSREKGERPLVSVSEGRLYCNKSIQLIDRREAIKADARAQIMNALDIAKPQTEQEFAKAIEAALGGELSGEAAEKVQTDAAEDLARVEVELGPEVALLAQVENFDERKELAKALQAKDEATVGMLVKRQPARWQRKWAQATALAV